MLSLAKTTLLKWLLILKPSLAMAAIVANYGKNSNQAGAD